MGNAHVRGTLTQAAEGQVLSSRVCYSRHRSLPQRHQASRWTLRVASAGLASIAAVATLAGARQAGPSGDGQYIVAVSDSAEVVNTVRSFHSALAAGDTARVLDFLASDVVIQENGDVEVREEYRAHHLAADIAFARTVASSRTPIRVVAQGDVAWVASTTTSQGEYHGRPINSVGTELMVLTRAPNGWQIRSIHWSSHVRRTR